MFTFSARLARPYCRRPSRRTLAPFAAWFRRVAEALGQPVHAAVESMNDARFVHDQLKFADWQVEIADALKVYQTLS
jgi:hypothetical protein